MNNYLYYPDKGSFRILTLADIQESKILSEDYQNSLLTIIDESQPDLIVLLGDMIFGPVLLSKKKIERIINSIIEVLDRAKVPFTFVFGNHDLDAIMSPEHQVALYRTSQYCLTPALSERQCAQAYSMDVHSRDDEKLFTLIFFDSGATCLTRYGISYKGPDSAANKWADDLLLGSAVPCFAFQHVPVLSIYKLLQAYNSPVEGSVKGHGMYRGQHLTLSEYANGILGESPCPEWQDKDLQFETWTSSDNLKAAVFGHDHKNAFDGVLDGITLLQSPCIGLNCYGNDETRGARLIDIAADGSFSSQIIFYSSI